MQYISMARFGCLCSGGAAATRTTSGWLFLAPRTMQGHVSGYASKWLIASCAGEIMLLVRLGLIPVGGAGVHKHRNHRANTSSHPSNTLVMPAPAEDLLHCWLSDRADEIVWATLQKGSQMAKLYNEATRPHLQSILGPLFTPADCYCLPTEAKHQVCTGLLRAHPAFDHLRQMMSETELKELAIGQPLADVLLRLDVYMQEQTASKHVFFLVCSEKASVILACTHAGCPHFHYDSHCCDVRDLTLSAATLARSGRELPRGRRTHCTRPMPQRLYG